MIRTLTWLKTVFLAGGLYCLLSLGWGVACNGGSAWAAPGASLPALTVAYLPPGNAITDGRSLLRYSLPIDNKEIRDIQSNLEGLSDSLRAKRWGPVKKDLNKVERVLSRGRDKILEAIPADRRSDAAAYLDDLQNGLPAIQEAVANQDKEAVWQQRGQMLADVSRLEEMMVTEFPFEVPEEYSNLPQLKGRATVEF